MLDARAARVIVTVLVFAAALAFIYAARHTLLVFLFAILFAYLIDPVVERVSRLPRLSRGKAIAVVYVALFGVLGIFFAFAGPRLAQEASHLGHSLPDLYQKIASGQIAIQIGTQRGWSIQTQAAIQNFLASHRGEALQWASRFGAELAGVGKNLGWLLLVPILAVFFLKEGRDFAQSLLDLLERRQQKQFAGAVMEDINEMLAHFIRAQLTLALLSLIFYMAVLLGLRVPYAAALGLVGGLLEFIPVVGPLIAALLILGVALATGYHHLILLAAFLGGWRILQDYYTSPRIMGSRIELHPLAVLFGVLVGAEIAGVLGVYLSIPIMASLRIVWLRWRQTSPGFGEG